MKNKTYYLILTALLIMNFNAFPKNAFDEPKPNGISEYQWLSLQQATLEQKLLPTPNGLGGQNAHLGRSFSIDDDRMLVTTSSKAIMFEFDGDSWIETEKITDTSGITVVALSENHAAISSFKSYSYATPGVVNTFEFKNNQWIESTQIKSSDGVNGDEFGHSLNISGDRMVVGAPLANGRVGAAYVFEFDGNNWNETAKLTASNAYGSDNFGHSVVIDGDMILVGAPNHTGGIVYSFEFDGNIWDETAIITSSDPKVGGRFGLAMSLKNNQVLIGADGNNGSDISSGAAYLFEYNGDDWTQKAKLFNTDGINVKDFGKSVALGNGQIIVVSRSNSVSPAYAHVFEQNDNQWIQTSTITSNAQFSSYTFGTALAVYNDQLYISSYYDNGSNDSGGIEVYNKPFTEWVKTTDIVASDSAAYDQFGYEVSLSGNRALVGAYGDNESDDDHSGAAYFFEYDGENWINVGKFTGNGGSFGKSVSLSGNSALIGAPDENTDINDSGAVYFYFHNGIKWNEAGKLVAEDPVEGSDFGLAVDIENWRAVVGAPRQEAVYVFDFNDNLLQFEQTAKLVKPEGNEDILFGRTLSLSDDRILISGHPFPIPVCMITCPPYPEIEGYAYIFEYDGNTWLEMPQLTASDGFEGNYFGASVSLDNDRAIIGAPLDDEYGNGAGAAYVFDFDGVNWVESTKLTATNPSAHETFGAAISLSGDQALISTAILDSMPVEHNKVYTFKNVDNTWNEFGQITPNANESQHPIEFGTSVSLSGSRALIGAPSDNEHGTNAGSAYILNFDLISKHKFE